MAFHPGNEDLHFITSASTRLTIPPGEITMVDTATEQPLTNKTLENATISSLAAPLAGVEINESAIDNSEITGSDIITSSYTPLVANVTATADGLTTGIIPAGTGHATVTSSDASHIVVLPPPVVGYGLTIFVASSGCELRSSNPDSIAINGGTGEDAESALGNLTLVYAKCVGSTAWRAFQQGTDGTLNAVEAAAP